MRVFTKLGLSLLVVMLTTGVIWARPAVNNGPGGAKTLDPPTNLTATVFDNVNVNVSWDAPGGGPTGSILCVDRDGSSPVGGLEFTDDWQYLEPALIANGLTYDYYEVEDVNTQDGPDLATMEQYDLIIWFTGESWHNGQTMTSTDESNLAAYLDNGGNLLLLAQDYFYDVYPSAGNFSAGQFPYDYLGVSSVTQDNWIISSPSVASVSGVTGSFAEGITFTVQDIYTTAKDALYIDQITTTGTDALEVTDPTPSGIAACQYTGSTFKTIFSTISFAAIVESDALNALLGNAVSWLMPSENKALLSYNVYRDGQMIANVPASQTDYDDMGLAPGTYEYYATAVYDEGESGASNTATVEITVNPNLDPPTNLAATVNGSNVDLTWDAPGGGGGNGEWIAWDDGTNVGSVGLQNGGTFYTASHWEPADLTAYDGMYLTKISFFAAGDATSTATYVLKVWQGENAGTQLLSQDVANVTFGEWNEITLDSPVMIDASQELWFGYEVTHAAGEYPGGRDAGPAIQLKGDMLSFDATSWVSMAAQYGLDYNWNIEGYVESSTDGTPAEPMVKETVQNTAGELISKKASTTVAFNNSSKALQGYNIYRDGANIDYTTETTYTDAGLNPGTYEYFVTAVYDEGESVPSNSVTAEIQGSGPVLFEDNFDAYTAGEQVACQNPDDWTTWSLSPCDATEDAYVSDTYAHSGPNSVNIVNNNDLVKPLGDGAPLTSGAWKITFWMYIPTGNDAYWNTLQEFAGSNSTWGMEAYFDGGQGKLNADGSNPVATFSYPYDTWFLNELIIDLDNDMAVFIVDGSLVYQWQWSVGTNNSNLLQLAANDFYGYEQTNPCSYYIDDYKIEEYTPPPSSIFEDDFEAYNAGEQLACQNPDDWTTWSEDPCNATEDPYISDAQAHSGSNSVNIVSDNDCVKPFENYTSGKYKISFYMYVPTGADGYWNTLQDFAGSNSVWGMQVYFGKDAAGAGSVDAGGAGAGSFVFNYDTWIYNELFVDLNADWAQYYVDGTLIVEWQWSTGTFGNGNLNQLAACNFYGWTGGVNGNSNYYFDDFMLEDVSGGFNPPENVQATVYDDINVHVTWDAPSGDTKDLTGYKVYRNGDEIANVSASQTNYDDENLEPGDYEYCVAAVYSDGQSEQVCAPTITIYDPNTFCDNFDSYNAGEQLACQNPDNWTTWSVDPCNATEDPYISTDFAYSGSNSVNIVNDNDLVKIFGDGSNLTEGEWKISFWMYIPTDKDAYWNILQDFAGNNSAWGMEAYFDGGEGKLNTDGQNPVATFSYPYDTWFLNEVYISLDEDLAMFILDGNLVYSWQWSVGTSNSNLLQLAAADFYGYQQTNPCSYYFDDFCIEATAFPQPPVTLAPTNLTGPDEVYFGEDINLSWDAPTSWIHWDSGENANAVGVSSGATFFAASHWDVEDIAGYDGLYLTKISFFPAGEPGAASTFSLRVWEGENAGTLLLSQDVTVTFGEWNEFTLDTPVMIDGSQEFWFGYEVVNAVDEFPAGCDEGPALALKGDMLSFDGSSWVSMFNQYGLDYNFNIQGMVTVSDNANAPAVPLVKPVVNNKGGELTAVATPQGPNNKFVPSTGTAKELSYYKVYRDDEEIGTTTETNYTDSDYTVPNLPYTFTYYVTAVYNGSYESDPSNSIDVEILTGVDEYLAGSIEVYPNPATDVVNVKSDVSINSVKVYNYSGQVIVNEQVNDMIYHLNTSQFKPGVYFFQIDTEEGVISKRIIIK